MTQSGSQHVRTPHNSVNWILRPRHFSRGYLRVLLAWGHDEGWGVVTDYLWEVGSVNPHFDKQQTQ